MNNMYETSSINPQPLTYRPSWTPSSAPHPYAGGSSSVNAPSHSTERAPGKRSSRDDKTDSDEDARSRKGPHGKKFRVGAGLTPEEIALERAAREELQTEVARLRADLKDCMNQIEAQKQTPREDEAMQDDERSQLQEARDQVTTLQSNQDDMNQRFSQLNEEVRSSLNALKRVEEENKALREEREAFERRRIESENEIQALKRQASRLTRPTQSTVQVPSEDDIDMETQTSSAAPHSGSASANTTGTQSDQGVDPPPAAPPSGHATSSASTGSASDPPSGDNPTASGATATASSSASTSTTQDPLLQTLVDLLRDLMRTNQSTSAAAQTASSSTRRGKHDAKPGSHRDKREAKKTAISQLTTKE
ncbi:hypothetical protein PM082_021908 [Marasmius tenuissimus]|nr:hypothetical protein PM082_021908 [Marasmius tenuissimus]